MIPNGGLGGLVPLRHDGTESLQVMTDPSCKPLRKFRSRPPPLRISSAVECCTASPAQLSATSSLGVGGLWTPQTPTDRRKHLLLGGDNDGEASPTTSRHVTTAPRHIFASPPETPISEKQTSLAELPGSLLLASQGYPQSLPMSPPPSLRLLRRDTEESSLSSVPSLSGSVSTDEGTMETFRNLAARRQDRSKGDMPSSYTIGSRLPTVVVNPYAVMGHDELLDTLPGCDTKVIYHHWIPAMRNQIGRMMNALLEADKLQVDRGVDEITMNNVSMSLTLIGFGL